MEFLLYLTPESKQILDQIYKSKFLVYENAYFCKNKNVFGYADLGKKFVICTKNIKDGGYDVSHYVNETLMHEAVHIAHMCNGYKPFGISKDNMPLSSDKIQNVRDSVKNSRASYQMEHEAYWMEDKPDKINYVIQKYCF
jgi:hypothetical protein